MITVLMHVSHAGTVALLHAYFDTSRFEHRAFVGYIASHCSSKVRTVNALCVAIKILGASDHNARSCTPVAIGHWLPRNVTYTTSRTLSRRLYPLHGPHRNAAVLRCARSATRPTLSPRPQQQRGRARGRPAASPLGLNARGGPIGGGGGRQHGQPARAGRARHPGQCGVP